MKSETVSQSDPDGGSIFEEKSQADFKFDDEMPEKYQIKFDKLEGQVNKLNQSMKDKNEKILELLSELEEVKI